MLDRSATNFRVLCWSTSCHTFPSEPFPQLADTGLMQGWLSSLFNRVCLRFMCVRNLWMLCDAYDRGYPCVFPSAVRRKALHLYTASSVAASDRQGPVQTAEKKSEKQNTRDASANQSRSRLTCFKAPPPLRPLPLVTRRASTANNLGSCSCGEWHEVRRKYCTVIADPAVSE